MNDSSHRAVVLAEGLGAGYGPQIVLHDVSIQVDADATSVIVGPGGSGKSTLLRLLSRPEDRPPGLWTRGQLDVRERRRSARLPQQLVRHELSLAQMVAIAGVGTNPTSAIEDFWSCAPEAGRALVSVIDVPFQELPTEIARLAAFTSTLFRPERVFLLDEAEAQVEMEVRIWMQQKLTAIRGQKTIIAVTHHLEFARAIANQVVLLVDGVIVESGTVEEFFSGPRQERTKDFVRFGS